MEYNIEAPLSSIVLFGLDPNQNERQLNIDRLKWNTERAEEQNLIHILSNTEPSIIYANLNSSRTPALRSSHNDQGLWPGRLLRSRAFL